MEEWQYMSSLLPVSSRYEDVFVAPARYIHRIPEHELLVHVIRNAVMDCYCQEPGREGRHIRAEAQAWLRSDSDAIWTFCWMAGQLFDPAAGFIEGCRRLICRPVCTVIEYDAIHRRLHNFTRGNFSVDRKEQVKLQA